MNKYYIIFGVVTLFIFLLYFFKAPLSLIRQFKKKQDVTSILNIYENDVSNRLDTNFKSTGITIDQFQLSLIAYKEERLLEVYIRSTYQEPWKLLKTYPFTGFSGQLGPKLKEGDRQIPEGIYQIESLNPNSAYHLSLRVNYPNTFDIEMGTLDHRTDLGSDIMIHGKNVTIGCIPIGDKNIEELFVLAAKCTNKNKISLLITPWDFKQKEEYPKIQHIDWEIELYQNIKNELNKYTPLL